MKLYCRQMGDGDPVVILHGLFGMSDNWLTIAKQLSTVHHCYILDMRNHGRSPKSPDLNYDDMVEDVYEFLTDFGLRTVSFIGHSMGGMVAMKFAFEYSHRIDKLVIVDIAPRSYPALHQNILEGLKSIPIDKIKPQFFLTPCANSAIGLSVLVFMSSMNAPPCFVYIILIFCR